MADKRQKASEKAQKMERKLPRKFDEAFKVSALQLADELGSVAQAAKRLNIHDSVLYNWKSRGVGKKSNGSAGKARSPKELERSVAKPANGEAKGEALMVTANITSMSDVMKENARLESENARLKKLVEAGEMVNFCPKCGKDLQAWNGRTHTEG